MRAAGLPLIAQSLAIILLIAHYSGEIAAERRARDATDAQALRLMLDLERATGQRDAIGQAYMRIKRHHCGT
jgi:hypothetical protein